jgi:hypothetical protein
MEIKGKIVETINNCPPRRKQSNIKQTKTTIKPLTLQNLTSNIKPSSPTIISEPRRKAANRKNP